MMPDQPPVPGPTPQPVPGPPPTHGGAIDAALVGLEGLDDLPVGEHVGRFDAVHLALTEALSTIDRV